MYLILKQESMYHWGTLCSFMAWMCSWVRSLVALPFRTISMILKAILGSRPLFIR